MALIRRATGKWTPAVKAALLYSCHPINTVFLNLMTTKIFVIQALCLNAALLVFAKGRHSPLITRALLTLISLCFYLLALLSHPSAFIFPIVIWLWAFHLEKDKWRQGCLSAGPFLIILGGYGIFCQFSPGLRISVGYNFQALHLSALQYISSVFNLLGWYFFRLLGPRDIIFIVHVFPYSTPGVSGKVSSP